METTFTANLGRLAADLGRIAQRLVEIHTHADHYDAATLRRLQIVMFEASTQIEHALATMPQPIRTRIDAAIA
jgi:hypothetical protein